MLSVIGFFFLFVIPQHFSDILIRHCFPEKDAGDGQGTAKTLLDKIANLESEAQKSFMHRSVIFGDFDSLLFFFLMPYLLVS